MIHVIHQANRHLYSDLLERLYVARFHHFVEERGWRLAHEQGREVDAYDDEHALHLVGLEADLSIAVSCRVRPTLTGGVIPDLFPHLISPEEPCLRAPNVYECTRYFCAAHLRGRAGFGPRSSLHIALLEMMAALQAERLVGFVDLPILTHLRRYSGLQLRTLGDAQPYAEDGTTIAFEVGLSPQACAQARKTLALPGRQLFDAPAWIPANVKLAAVAEALDVFCNGQESAVAQLSALASRLRGREVTQNGAHTTFDRLTEAAA